MKLQRLTTRSTLARRLLYTAVSMVFAGCIVPTPLQQAEQTPNYRPTLVTNLVDPPFGPLPKKVDDVVELKLVAEDPNLGDTLSARLFSSRGPTSRLYLGLVDAPLNLPTVSDTVNPTRRTGRFLPLKLCSVLNLSGGQGAELYVEVADRPFSTVLGHENEVPGGLFDENHWELKCD